ncbi:hypothetical protein EVAR_97668_1 [Eumeta japonica]|uniref:Pacifastin domain-containing protein n=1 Tax=Eumeta variegata TaxID=151549 RepID=A0A4C1X0X6_EUMVA|nr:hypothetical protein EVAR_97668_1 [Eumeta japonica]
MRCAPGTKWRDGCRRCDCGDDGTAACAEALCGEGRRQDALDTSLGVGKECEVGTGWQNGCNKCHCSEDGRAYCTVNRCPTEVDDEVSMQCAPGSRWQYECNGCYCTAEGRPRCTVMDCYDEDCNTKQRAWRPSVGQRARARSEFEFCPALGLCDVQVVTNRRVKKSTCKPRQTFKRGCNTCKCASDGLSYHCTDNECVAPASVEDDVEVFIHTNVRAIFITFHEKKNFNEKGREVIQKHSVCRPHSHFKMTCHTCLCNDDGTDYACPTEPCPVPKDVELFHELRVSITSIMHSN